MKKVNLAEFRQRFDAASIEIDAGDETFVIPPPQLWSDELVEAAGKIDPNDGASSITFARALLGDRYNRFVECGGSAVLLAAIIEENQGASVGES